MSKDILQQLDEVLAARKNGDAQQSYVAGLYQGGADAIVRKIGEEAIETVVAGKNGQPDQMIHEVADLWFHTLVLLAYFDLSSSAVLGELERRFGLSGLEEKSQRK